MKSARFIGYLTILLVLTCGISTAQIATGEPPHSFTTILRVAKADVQAIRMPDVDIHAYLAEDEIEEELGMPLRFGAPFDVSYTPENSGSLETTADGGRLWRLKIESPGAYSINLLYDRFRLPEGAKLHLYNDDGSIVLGAFTHRNNKEHGQFATGLVKGDVTIVEYYEPAEVDFRGEISISRVVHGYRNMFDFADLQEGEKLYGDAGSCNNNVNCPEGDPWRNQIRGVAMVITGSGTRWCTGSMINNVREDETPYFLTANHCLGGEASWIIMFNYESPGCYNQDGPTWMTVQGTTLLANSSISDFALVHLSEAPPDSYYVYFSGWSALNIPSTSSTAIHHPSGDIKKISFDTDPVTSTEYLSTGTSDSYSHWRIGSWDDGTTEGGSSGSPLYDQNKRIVGQLHGGYASCTSPTSDWYGKVWRSWTGGGSSSTRLRDWLDPDNTGATTLDGFDPFAGVTIEHTPIEDTRDTLVDYEVLCTITTGVGSLIADSLLLYYQLSSVWYEDTLVHSGGPNPDEYHGFIPAQLPGTSIDYYLVAIATEGKSDTTDTYNFRIVDYAMSIEPELDSAVASVGDTIWYSMTVTNDGIIEDSYSLAMAGGTWPITIWDEYQSTEISVTSSMLPDETFDFYSRVIIPVSSYNDFDIGQISAVSVGNSLYSAVSTLKSISLGQTLDVPFLDTFPLPMIDSASWVVSSGIIVTGVGIDEPTAQYSVNLNGYPAGRDTLMSQIIDFMGETDVRVSYFYQRTGGGDSPENNDDLYVEYLNDSQNWVIINQHLGSGADMAQYELVEYVLPSNAYHNSFRLRFRNIGTSGAYDDWFVDNILVGPPSEYNAYINPPGQTQLAATGDSAQYRLWILNRGQQNDSYFLTDLGNSWDVAFFDSSGQTEINSTAMIPADDSGQVIVKVLIPPEALEEETDTVEVRAYSMADPLVYGTTELITQSAGLPGTFPWTEIFPDDTIITERWLDIVGATVSTLGVNPPSSPYSLDIDGFSDTAVTRLIDLGDQPQAILTYSYQRGGNGEKPEETDSLYVDYKNIYGEWINIHTYNGTNYLETEFEIATIGLPDDALHPSFQLRVINIGSCADCDDWFVDDIKIGYPPSVTIDPVSYTFSIDQGDSAVTELVIGNTGLGDLIYQIGVMPQLKTEQFNEYLRFNGTYVPADQKEISGLDPASISIAGLPDKAAGGPDLSGYYWLDSDDPGGPIFDWIDITGTGSAISGLADDAAYGPYSIGFDFEYYGVSYSQIYIGTNGLIGFVNDNVESKFLEMIPSATTPNSILAWLWDDLDPTDADNPTAAIYYHADDQRCIIQFVDYPEAGADVGDVVNAEIILKPDGSILFQYQSIAPGFDAGSCTVGIENQDGTDGLQAAYLQPYLKDNLAIQFYQPSMWITLNQGSGTIIPTEADTISVKVQTEILDVGTYYASIVISSNDPDSPLSIPVELTVNPGPPFLCGDADDDEIINLSDILYLIDHVYGDPKGPAPLPPAAGDVNADTIINLSDILYLISFVYLEPPGPAPNCIY